jgi:hypothetical protein
MAAETLIIPIAGAGNCGKERVSTAAPHFYFMLRKLKQIKEAKVSNPLVPAGFGVFGSLDKTYDQMRAIFEKIEQERPDSRKIVVGHSLGGLLGRRLVVEGLADTVVGIGSPQLGLQQIIPSRIRSAYREFGEAIPDNAEPGQIALIGYRFDELVPLESSLPELQNVDRHEHLSPTTHNFLLLTPGVIKLSERLVRAMAEGTEPSPAVHTVAALPLTA